MLPIMDLNPNRLRPPNFSFPNPTGDPDPRGLTPRVRGYSDGGGECRFRPEKFLDPHPTPGEGGVVGGGTLTGCTGRGSGGTSLTDGGDCSGTGVGMFGAALLPNGLASRFAFRALMKETGPQTDFSLWGTSVSPVSLLSLVVAWWARYAPRRCTLLADSSATAAPVVFTLAEEETGLVVRSVGVVGDESEVSSSARFPLVPTNVKPSRRAIQVPVTTMNSRSLSEISLHCG